jgi:diketogulonate reductase-like aldo/keto reductase
MLLLISLLCCEPRVVSANFFSRIMRLGQTSDDPPVPSGAQAATGSAAQVGSIIAFEDGVLMAHLSNDNRIPLIGIGVGNSPHKIVGALVAEAIQDDKRIRLIDTAHASHNEELVAEGIVAGAEKRSQGGKVEVHVITKVWYTHLGYERTKLSVEQSLKSLQHATDSDKVDLKIHFLLHWPRCYDNIAWMDCVAEEQNLDPAVKKAGPDPHKDTDNAWKESWKYLEDLYLSDKYPIESIGLSNFPLEDIEKMDSFARIHPQVLQVNLWSLLYDSLLVDYCHKHRIHIQVYNAMHGTVGEPGRAPHAYHHIQKVAYELTTATGLPVSPAQTVLSWLIQHGVSVIPRTSKLTRLQENSAVVLSTIPALADSQVETVAHAVEAYMSGDDMTKDIHVSVTFHAVNEDLMLYWVAKDGRETRIDHIRKGDSFDETTYPNHVFRTYNAYNKDIYVEHQIDANFGEHKHIHVEL